MLRKLAFVAFVFNQFEYGLQCLQRARELADEGLPEASDHQLSYLEFLRALETAVHSTTPVYPQTFAARYSEEDSRGRYKISVPGTGKPRAAVSNMTVLLGAVTNRFGWSKWLKRRLVAGAKGARIPQGGNSPVETVLMEYSLDTQAQLLKKTRLAQSA